MTSPLFCLMGPTASGKTAAACQLVDRFPFEIVSVDSVMVYRDLNIGAAKPDAQTLKRYPHHLIDCIDPTDAFSAAQFCDTLDNTCQTIFANGHYPLLTGGTMMYFNALQKGLSSLPEANPAIRERLLKQADEQGWHALHQQLMTVDPITAKRIHPNDTQRIQRALEVFLLTKEPLSALQKRSTLSSKYTFYNFALIPHERHWLHQQIALRFQHMLTDGLIDEVKTLVKQWNLTADMPSMRSVGYRQVMDFLNGKTTETEMLDKGIAATRQLAKRQLTWLRQWPDLHCYNSQDDNSVPLMSTAIQKIVDRLEMDV